MKTQRLLLGLFLALFSSGQALAQQKPQGRDSVLLRHYLDSAFSSPLFSEARQHWLDSALRITPQRAWFWQQKSMPLDKAGKYELAIPYLDSAVKYDAQEWLDYRAFVKCIFHKNYRGGLQDFYAAKALNGNIGVMDHPYDFYIALCHLQLNRFDSAADYLDRCIARRQQNGGDDAVHYLHWFYRGIVCMELRQYDAALSCLDKSLRQYATFPDAEYYKAACLMDLRRFPEALTAMESAQKHFNEGYSMNEDNALYERYPYQIRKYYLEGAVNYLREKR